MQDQLHKRSTRLPLAVVVTAGALAAGFVVLAALSNPEHMLAKGYAAGPSAQRVLLDEVENAFPRVMPAAYDARGSRDGRPANGTIHAGAQQMLKRPLAVGARVEIATGHASSGPVRLHEVIEVEDIDAPVAGLPGIRLQLVDLAPVDGDGEPVRKVFMIDERVDQRGNVDPAARGRAL